jgi:Arc/MetJ-type ribon-helix-helix transcriptional regulator
MRSRERQASEYIRELVRADQKREAELKETEERVVAMLLEGIEQLERGETVEVTPEFWQQKRKELFNRLGNKTRA